MRQIKFRAWSKPENAMIDDFYMHSVEGIGGGGLLSDKDDYTLMQYTGLKDKNGVEIFEGDIVNLDIDGEFMDGHRLTPDFKDPFIVEEKEGCFECRFIEGEKETFPISEYWQASNDLEVIGNIYENPELTNKQNH